MSEENETGDKQFEATQHKLDEARKKGDIPKSNDLTTAAAYTGLLAASLMIGANSLTNAGAGLAGLVARAPETAEAIFHGDDGAVLGGLILSLSGNMAPFFAIPAALVMLTLIGQRGIVFATSKLAFKLSRISPLAQAKNKFGRSGLFEFFKSFIKLVLYSTVLFIFLANKLPDILATIAYAPGQTIITLLKLCQNLLGIVLVIALALGVIDYSWQRAEHLRKNRMSHKEMRDETKNSEGDPAMKQQRRQKGVEIAMNQMLADVPQADVVIVNPTHFAVALSWNRSSHEAPKCVAKGVDEVAARIREIALENNVPIHPDPPTARALHATVEIGDQIHPDHYKAVAAAIRFADRLQKAART